MEIEVEVRQIGSTSPALASPRLFDLLGSLMLAGIGAVATTRDEIDQFVGQVAAQGELVRKDSQRLMQELTERRRMRMEANRVRVEQFIEARIDQMLGRLSISSKRDIDDLSAKIAQLSARVEELTATKGAGKPG